MPTLNLGHTLVIANPTSHSGKGAAAIEHVRRFFESYGSATRSFDLELTHAPLDAVEIDRKSTRLNSSHPTTSRMPSSA